jgi:hypothetical protein
LRILLFFFFNVYFVFGPWNSDFHLFQSAGVAFNWIFKFVLREFLFPGFLFKSFFWDFPCLC